MSIRARAFIAFVLTLIVGAGPARTDEEGRGLVPQGFALNPEIADLLLRAEEAKQPVLLIFDAPGCGFCTLLKENTLPREDVRALLANVVTAHYVEGHVDADTLIERHRIRGFPTTMILNARGEEIDRIAGYGAPETYAPALARILDGKDTLAALRSIPFEDRSAEQSLLLCGKLVDADPAEALALCDRLLQADAEVAGDSRADVMLQRAEALGHLDRHEEALAEYEDVLAEWPASKAAHLLPGAAIPVLLAVDPRRALRFVLAAPDHEDPAARAYVAGFERMLHVRAAADAYEHVAKDAGDAPEVLNQLAWECYELGILTDEAAEWARRAVDLSDRAAHILDTHARLLFRRGRLAEALTLEREALSKARTDEERSEYEEVVAWFEAVQRVRESRPKTAKED